MSPKQGYPKFLTVGQVAEMLQIKVQTVYKYLRAGKIPGVRVGSIWRVNEEDLLKFLKSKKQD